MINRYLQVRSGACMTKKITIVASACQKWMAVSIFDVRTARFAPMFVGSYQLSEYSAVLMLLFRKQYDSQWFHPHRFPIRNTCDLIQVLVI